MNIAQQLEYRGMQKGMQKERLHIAKHMLVKLHMDLKTVSEATSLSERTLMRLQEEGGTEELKN